ncbi:hypothetical protein FO519_003048 [Halicephalobus sp. NKZ332]|nr:hypothetical protein FO519_003048 [Halicephalobus sp. NKZ332]
MTSQEENLCSNPDVVAGIQNLEVPVQSNMEDKEDLFNNSDSTSSFSSESNSNKIPLKRSSSSNSGCGEIKTLPRFIASAPEGTVVVPTRVPTSPCGDFPPPKFPKPTLQLSRPNSPSNAGRPILPRSRIANIRRESDCSMESEVAHERFIKTAVQVSTGFEDFCLDDKAEDRKRAKSLTDPISITILTSAFQSSAASPTRSNEVGAKQCYSPATQQLRRYTNSGNVSGLDSDNEGPPLSSKRQCTSISKNNICGSPLVRDAPSFPNPPSNGESQQRPTSPMSECSTTSSFQSFRPKTLVDPAISACINSASQMDSDDSVMDLESGNYTDAPKDDQSSTTFSSRAGTPVDDQFGDSSRLNEDTGLQLATTPTGLIRSFQAGSPNPFAGGRLPLPPSPLTAQRKMLKLLVIISLFGILRAQINPSEFQPLKMKAPKPDEPIIVVGGGLAGLSATLEALRSDASVILIDKSKDIGGNSAKASSGINGAGTETQKKLNIEDTTDKFYSDTMSAGDRENDPGLVDLLVHDSAAAVEFLIDVGVDLTDINLCGGHSVPRTHWIPSPKEGKPLPVGVAIIKALKNKVIQFGEENPGKLKIETEREVVGIVTWNDYVTGVRYQNSTGHAEEIKGKAVVLATGGFSADRTETSLLKEFASDKMKLPTTNGAFATGDGVKMARAMGAAVVGLKNVQIHPTAFIDFKNPTDQTKFLAAEALRGKGAILVNEKGERFGNELGRRDYLTDKISKQCAQDSEAGGLHVAFMLMSERAADSFGRPAFNFYANIKGFFKKFDNAEEASKFIGAKKENLVETLKNYNDFVQKYAAGEKVKDKFEKNVFPEKINPDEVIYVAKVTPAIHYTMGGLKIDRQAVVFSEFMDKPFKGLLAAGEVTGGVHGRNRLAGNSLLECVVFGRIAGRNAAGVNYNIEHEEL